MARVRLSLLLLAEISIKHSILYNKSNISLSTESKKLSSNDGPKDLL